MKVDQIELGGSITLYGFSLVSDNELVVIKKIVGQFVKWANTERDEFEQLEITLEDGDDKIITAHADIAGKNYESSSEDTNLFFALTEALDELRESIK